MGLELTEFGFGGVTLMDGERVAFAINMADSAGRPSSRRPEALLLTDSRIIHLSGGEKQRRAVMAAVKDVEAVEITASRQGYSAYLWAALAVVLSIVMFGTIENTGVKLASSAIVLLMGVYLVVSQVTEPGNPMVVFRAGGSEIQWEFDSGENSEDVNSFINRLYQIKESSVNHSGAPASFAPR
jgi:hypothetical protein